MEALINVYYYFVSLHVAVDGGMYKGRVSYGFPYFIPLIWSHLFTMFLVLFPIPRVGGGRDSAGFNILQTMEMIIIDMSSQIGDQVIIIL